MTASIAPGGSWRPAEKPRVDVLMVTHDRADYVRLSLPRLLAASGPHVRVWVWHNGDHAETLAAVEENADHPGLEIVHHSRENVGLRQPTNWLWQTSTAAFVAKVDDDCLVDHAWADPLLEAHLAAPALGVVGAWRFLDEDYRRRWAERKMQPLPDGHRLLRNLWVQGSSYVMKREVIDAIGVLSEEESFARYCRRAAEAGFINGWVYPFVRERHLDDPRFPQSHLRDEARFQREMPLSAKVEGVRTVKQWRREMTISALRVQRASLDPGSYHGVRGKAIEGRKRVRRLVRRLGAPI